MSSKKNSKSETVAEYKDMENVELHRAESMVTENIEVLDEINKEKHPEVINDNVYNYIGRKARSCGSMALNFTSEFVMFMYMFSYIVRTVTSTAMIMEKVCLVHLNYPEGVCHDLQGNPDIKTEVEKQANNYQLGHTFISMMPSAVLALFIGSWSDKYSRKLPIIVALVGSILDGFGATVCAYYLRSRIEYYFLPALFTGLSGGFIGVLMVLYAYASDVTTSSNRTMKYALMELSFGLAMPIGSLVGGWLYKFSGYVPVFVTSTCGHILGLVVVVFFLDETRGLDNKDSWMQKFVNLWKLDSVVSSFKTTAKKRPNRGTVQLWLLILAMSISVFSFASLAGVMFFYVHHMYNWENTTFSTVNAVYQVLGLGLMLIIVPLSKKYKVGDPILGIAGSLSLMLKNIGIGLAFKIWIYHVASLLGLFNSLGSLASRSRVSKIVSKDDLGKVFAFVTTAESILPIFASAIVSQAFNASIDFFPGLIFVIMGILTAIPLGVYIWIARLPATNYEEMDESLPRDNVQIKAENTSQQS